MFGEEIMMFERNCNIGEKNRLILPSATYAEKNDQLYFERDSNLSIALRNYNFLKELVGKIERKSISIYEQRRIIDELFNNSYSLVTVDSQKRIVIPKKLMDEYDLGTSIFVKGYYDHLKIFKSEDTFKQYVKEYKS